MKYQKKTDRITKPTIYTEDFVKKEVKSILNEILKKKNVILLGEILEKKEYSRFRFSEWTKEFKDNKEISHAIKKIKDILEDRLNLKALENKTNATMTIFNLKNNYGWKDKSEQDLNVKMPKPLLENLNTNTNDNNNSNKENSETEEED